MERSDLYNLNRFDNSAADEFKRLRDNPSTEHYPRWLIDRILGDIATKTSALFTDREGLLTDTHINDFNQLEVIQENIEEMWLRFFIDPVASPSEETTRKEFSSDFEDRAIQQEWYEELLEQRELDGKELEKEEVEYRRPTEDE